MLLGQLFWQPSFDIEGHPFRLMVRLGDGLRATHEASAIIDQVGEGWVDAKALADLLEQMAVKTRGQLNA